MTVTIEKVTKDDPMLAFYWVAAMDRSTAIWVGRLNGEIALIWGIAPRSVISSTAFVWSVSAPPIRHCAKSMLKFSRAWLKEISAEFDELVGLCEFDTVWLKHLGAKSDGISFTIRTR